MPPGKIFFFQKKKQISTILLKYDIIIIIGKENIHAKNMVNLQSLNLFVDYNNRTVALQEY